MNSLTSPRALIGPESLVGDRGAITLPTWPQVRRHYARILAENNLLVTPFSLYEFIDRVQLFRGRPIKLIPARLPAGVKVCGLAGVHPTGDHILYSDSVSPLHRTHQILHELAHLLFESESDELSPPTSDPIADELSWEFGEWEADVVAAVLLGQRKPPPHHWLSTSTIQLAASRVIATFGWPGAERANRLQADHRTHRVVTEWSATAASMLGVASVLTLGLFGVWPPANLNPPGGLLYLGGLLAVGAIGTGLLTMAQNVATTITLRQFPLVPTGLAIGLIQCVLYYASIQPSSDDSSSTTAELLTVLVGVTMTWMTGAAAVLFLVLARYGRYLPRFSQRAATHTFRLGLLAFVMAVAVVGVACLLPSAPLPAATALAAARGLGIAAACCFALALLLPHAASLGRPAFDWARSWKALRDLTSLYEVVLAAAPRWKPVGPEPALGYSLSSIEDRLYQRIIAIRDGTWQLLGGLDTDVVVAAKSFAAEHVFPKTRHRVDAAADACMLAAALTDDLGPVRETHTPLEFRLPRSEPMGSVVEESYFLQLVARTWREWHRSELIATFLAQARAAREAELGGSG